MSGLKLMRNAISRINGRQCIVSCFQQTINNPPKLGSVLTVKHTGYYSNGVLKLPNFWREREDVSWVNITKTSSSPSSIVNLLKLKFYTIRFLVLPGPDWKIVELSSNKWQND